MVIKMAEGMAEACGLNMREAVYHAMARGNQGGPFLRMTRTGGVFLRRWLRCVRRRDGVFTLIKGSVLILA